ASHIPLASMAPTLMVVAFTMSEYKTFGAVLKLRTSDSLVLVTTFLLTVFVNLTVAVRVGLLLAMVSFVRRVNQVLKVKNISPHNYVDDLPDDQNVCPKSASFTIRGPLFFGAADQFETTLSQPIHKQPSVLILKMRHVSL